MAPSQQMHLVANSSVQPRAAFVLSGHLRDTCDGVNGTNAIVKQAIMCHEAFAGRCDVFLHTWSTLEKHVSMLRHSKLCHLKNASDHCQLDMFRVKQASRASSVCVDTIARRLANELPSSTLGVSRTLIEEQPEPLSPAVGWGAVGEAVDHNMFFQVEGIARVLEMAARERRRGENRGHHAVVRMRADFGIRKLQARPELWLNPQGWRNVHLRAKAAANGMLDERVSTEVLTCGWPHFKRTDMCFWSAPVAPVANTVKALRGEAFHRVVHDGNCSEYLKAIQGAPVVSENILLCGMRLVGAHRSYVQDRNIRARGLLGPPYVNGGERDYDQDLAPAARAPGMLPARNPFELGARTVNLHDYSL